MSAESVDFEGTAALSSLRLFLLGAWLSFFNLNMSCPLLRHGRVYEEALPRPLESHGDPPDRETA